MKQKKVYAILAVLVVVILGVYFLTNGNFKSTKTTDNQTKTEKKADSATTSQKQKASSKSSSAASSSSVKKAKVSETQAQDIVLKAHPNSKIQGNERRQSSGRDYYIVYYTDSDGTAKAAYVDVSSGDILYERNADE